MSQNILKFGIFKSWYPIVILKNIRQFFRNLVHAKNRVTKGFSAADTWNLDYYLANLIVDSVTYLRDNHCGYPAWLEYDQDGNKLDDVDADQLYVDKLNEIINCFNIVRQESCDLLEDKTYDFENYKDAEDFRQEVKHQGFVVLEEMFDSLWD